MFKSNLFIVIIAVGLIGAVAFAQTPRQGGTLTVALPQDIVTFDRMVTTAPPEVLRAMIFDGLFSFDENFRPQPTLVESWEVSEDGLTWTFELLRDVEFHDGTPMTAEDVVTSFDRYMRVGARSWEFERVESWEAVDDHTVRFHLSSPWAAFTESLAFDSGGFAVYPEWLVEEWGDEMGTSNFIGTGPYMVGETIPEERYQLLRYENHRSVPGPSSFQAGTRNAYVDEIILIPIPDDATRVSAFLAGEVDLAFQLPLDDFQRLEQAPDVHVVTTTPGFRVYLKMNATQGPFADPLLRQAVQAAMDFEEVMFTQGPPELWRVNPVPRFQEGQWMWVDNMDEFYPEDLELARNLVEQSDYDGEPIIFMASPGRVLEFRTVPIVDQILRDLGLNVQLVTYDAPTFAERRADLSQWHIKHAGGGSAVPVSYLGAGTRDRAGELWADFPIEEWDRHFDVTQEEEDLELRGEAVAELNRIYGEFANEIWFGDVFALTACRDHVQNCPQWYALWLTDVWLDE